MSHRYFQTNACCHSISLHQQHANTWGCRVFVFPLNTVLTHVQVTVFSWRPVSDDKIRLWMQAGSSASRGRPPATAPARTSTLRTWDTWVTCIWTHFIMCLGFKMHFLMTQITKSVCLCLVLVTVFFWVQNILSLFATVYISWFTWAFLTAFCSVIIEIKQTKQHWFTFNSFSLQMRLMGECRGSIDAVKRAEGELTEDEDDEPGLTNLTGTDTQGSGELYTHKHLLDNFSS